MCLASFQWLTGEQAYQLLWPPRVQSGVYQLYAKQRTKLPDGVRIPQLQHQYCAKRLTGWRQS